jgi:hypothetical protein
MNPDNTNTGSSSASTTATIITNMAPPLPPPQPPLVPQQQLPQHNNNYQNNNINGASDIQTLLQQLVAGIGNQGSTTSAAPSNAGSNHLGGFPPM